MKKAALLVVAGVLGLAALGVALENLCERPDGITIGGSTYYCVTGLPLDSADAGR